MNFNTQTECIGLNPADAWYAPGVVRGDRLEVGYEDVPELYSGLGDSYQEAIANEFDKLERARELGMPLEKAMQLPWVVSAETTYLAQRLITLRSVLMNHVESSHLD